MHVTTVCGCVLTLYTGYRSVQAIDSKGKCYGRIALTTGTALLGEIYQGWEEAPHHFQ
jgi:hypothetical protein